MKHRQLLVLMVVAAACVMIFPYYLHHSTGIVHGDGDHMAEVQ